MSIQKYDVPGPKARAIVERDTKHTSPSYPRDYPFVIDHGRGAECWDVDGNRYIDFAAGIAVLSTGHAHPEIVKAIQQQAEKYIHISSDFYHELMVALGERINEIAPMQEDVSIFYANSGTESVEAAIKLARYATGRQRFIGFLGAFHGRSMGSLSFTASRFTQQERFFPTMPGVWHVPFPDPYRPLFIMPPNADAGDAVIDYIENVLFAKTLPPEEVAAVWSSRSRAKAVILSRLRTFSRACASCAIDTASCSSRTKCNRALAAPANGGLSSIGVWSRISSASPKALPRECRWG